MIAPISSSTNRPARNFAYLWAARDLAALSDWMLLVALLAWSYQAQESATIVSILLVGLLLPPFLLAPLADLVVSPRNARVVGTVARLLRAVALLPLLTVTSNDDLRMVLAVAFLASIPSALSRASEHHLSGDQISRDRQSSPGGVLSRTQFLVMAVGSAAGTALYESGGLRDAAIATLAALLLSAALLLLCTPPPSPEVSAERRRSAAAVLRDLQEELLNALHNPILQPIAAVRLVAALAGGGLVVAQVAFVVWGLGVSAERVGHVLAAEGLGLVVGSTVFRFTRSRFPSSVLIATSLGLGAVALFGFAISHSITPALYLSAALGFGNGLLFPSLDSLLPKPSQEATGRSWTGLAMAAQAAALLSAIAMGPLSDSISPRLTLVLPSILLVVLALYSFGAVPDRESPSP